MSDKQLPDGIEWPRYDDGEPLGIGDCFPTPILHDKAQVKSIAFKGMCATIETDRGAHCKFGVGCRVMRPPVLDKDGQEIKVGDTVWDENGEKWTVVSFDFRNEFRVKGEQNTASFDIRIDMKPELLTHTQPDSWEKLREDARKSYENYWGCAGLRCNKCPYNVDVKSPYERYGTRGCDEAMRLDLIARAEKLAGVMSDD